MKYGFIIPRGDVHTIPKLAERVEAADGTPSLFLTSIWIETEDYPATGGFYPWIVLSNSGTYVTSAHWHNVNSAF